MASAALFAEFSTPSAKLGGVESALPMCTGSPSAKTMVSVQVPPTSDATTYFLRAVAALIGRLPGAAPVVLALALGVLDLQQLGDPGAGIGDDGRRGLDGMERIAGAQLLDRAVRERQAHRALEHEAELRPVDAAIGRRHAGARRQGDDAARHGGVGQPGREVAARRHALGRAALGRARDPDVRGLRPRQADHPVYRLAQRVDDGEDGEQAGIGLAQLDLADRRDADLAFPGQPLQGPAPALAQAPDLAAEIGELLTAEGALDAGHAPDTRARRARMGSADQGPIRPSAVPAKTFATTIKCRTAPSPLAVPDHSPV